MSVYFSTPEAARRLNVTRITIFRWIKSGKLTAHKSGRSYVIPAESVETLMKKGDSAKNREEEITESVQRVVKTYGNVLKKLGEE